ncbi:hypothetical protein AMAG_15012 [Allomyces macrogynus ATCC 38327]|uniref:SART-1 protein n=1 Tax=Allomyces macrogynus (strain ATCC 38327) TaxID=578462 RepID=A0A0L0T8M7_ALLM3|nr:hypothetical protein AMAG_15012 [Allomyces macrogynus ATCC 38327]|eukprot:KNE70919.1 hypothetical protein AMAG_15012 [Allomyces macrogynus ATCC 38327]
MDHLENDGAEAQVEISLSVEETNALRAKLGLKPLRLEGSDHDKKAHSNFAAAAAEQKKQQEIADVRRRLEKSQNRRKLQERLKGATLGTADDAIDNAAAWIQRQKKLAARKQQEFDGLESTAVAAPKSEYTSKDLAGLKVTHALDDLNEGDEMVLTLKDKGVLDEDDEDELENATLRDVEKAQEAVELRGKKQAYSGYDDDEFTQGRKTILAQYDEVIEGKKTARYTLTESGLASTLTKDKSPEELLREQARLSLNYNKMNEMDDFQSASEVTIKKSKRKKKAKIRSKTGTRDDDGDTQMGESLVTVRDRAPAADLNFVDDEDLQSVLAAARLRKQMMAKALPTMDEIAEDLASHATPPPPETDCDGDAALVFDETSEFVRGLNTTGLLDEIEVKQEPVSPRVAREGGDGDVIMRDALDGEDAGGDVSVKDEPVDDDDEDEWRNPIEDEPALNKGLGAAMELFRKRGALEDASEEQKIRERESEAQRKWELENFTTKDKSKAALRKRTETMAERLKDYKPNVNLEYYDAQGRQLSTKEAYKELSHKFHGRTSGKNKQEKVQRKEDERRRMMQMTSGDASASLASAMLERQKLVGAPGILLTVGNRPVSAGPSIQEPPVKKQRRG